MAELTCPPLRGGDGIFFWGTGFLSDSIKRLTHGPSHCATVLEPKLLMPDGSKQTELHVIESTIMDGVNGVQVRTLAERVNGYDKGGCVMAAYLSDRVRDFLDWDAVWEFASKTLARGERYNVGEIGAYLANLVLPGALQLDQSDDDSVVCSEFRAMLLQAGGMPGLDPFRTPPGRLLNARMYRPDTAVLFGTLPANALEHFNTV